MTKLKTLPVEVAAVLGQDSDWTPTGDDLKLWTSWLAGLWDGEGSVGIVRCLINKKRNVALNPTVQMSMTCLPTIARALRVMELIGVEGRGYTYQERKEVFKDAHYIRVSGMGRIKVLAEALSPWSVTKTKQWLLLLSFLNRRISLAGGFSASGKLRRRGGSNPYTSEDFHDYDVMRHLNARGGKSNMRRKGTVYGRHASKAPRNNPLP
jgi:hypothetical protein